MSLGKQEGIDAKSITKPIQLLAAWLVGLIFLNGTFLLTAKEFISIEWLSATLIIAAVINVPLFLLALFLLQTKFRPEIQEDHYYSQYIKNKLGYIPGTEPKLVNIPTIAKADETNDSLWSGINILFNPHLNISTLVHESLEQHQINITKNFGSKNWIPEFVIAIGRYLTYTQILSLLQSLEHIKEIYIAFANDEDYIYEYDKTILIGSYFYDIKEKTFPIKEAISLLKSTNGDVNKFYQYIFDKQRDDDA